MNLTEVREQVVPPKCVAVWSLGQVGVILKADGRVLYVDPYLSEHEGRCFAPPLKPEQVTNADFVFITHEHMDHFDPFTLKGVATASPHARFVAPFCCREPLRKLGVAEGRIIQARTDEWATADGLRFQPIPSAHYAMERDRQGNARYLGYLLQINGVTIYHAGDTIYYPGLLERLTAQPIDLAFLPINGRSWKREQMDIIGNLTSQEAADLAAAIRADMVIPTHWDLFAANTENFARFADHLYANYRSQKFHVLHVGEKFLYSK